MRCPKCGAFVDDGRDVCFMCGTNLKNPNMNNNMNQNNQNYFNNNMNQNSQPVSSGFSNGSMNAYQNDNKFNGLNNYDNIYNSVKKNDRDFFDFVSDHKILVYIVLFVFVVLILVFAANRYTKYKNKEVVLEPVIGHLYFKPDSSFNLQNSSNDGLTYSISNSQGSNCLFKISTGTSDSSNYVQEYFEAKKEELEPQRNETNLTVVNNTQVYTVQEGEMKNTINDSTWSYMNVFYPASTTTTEPTILKYRYLTTTYKSLHYDIELTNSNNDASCAAALDNFILSMQFITDDTSDSE